ICSTAVTASDNCDGDVTGTVTCTAGTISDVGTCGKSQTFTYKAHDICGNIVSKDVTYTWKVDATAPVLANLPVGGALGANPPLPICSTAVTASDNCDGDVTGTVTCTAGTIGDVGTCGKSQTFTYKAHDICGNIVSKDVTYTWKVDATAPVLANLPVGGDLGCNPPLPICSTAVTASDNCDGDVTGTVTCTPGTIGDVGTCGKSQTFTYKAQDICGNIVSKDVTYTWKVDATAPVRANLPVGGDLGCNPPLPICSTAVTASDNCDGDVTGTVTII